jgi:WhiB family transcriptional regulator, redox-sensing transcriptional regulator
VTAGGWQVLAACADEDPDLFIGPDRESAAARQEREAAALSVCRRCPVSRECALFAISRGMGRGVWGGMTEEQVRAARQVSGRRASGIRVATLMAARRRETVRARTAAGEKTCSCCGVPKPLGDFGSDASKPDGRTQHCKPCRASAARQSRRREKVAA